MQCPCCQEEMSAKAFDGVEVEVCRDGCAGLWFDHREFQKFDEPHEAAGEELLDLQPKKKVPADRPQMPCPVCDNVVMQRRFFSVKRHIEIDECANCGGIFLDAGELRQIRGLFQNEDGRRQAASAMMTEVFGPGMALQKEKSAQSLAKARRFAHMMRFICPSYYLKGKQDWGAF